jgi:hypothetical protein
MTIAAKLLQINGVKEDIRDAIESFGYDLSNVPFTEYAEWIAILGSETSITPTASGGNGNISDDLDELANVKADIKAAIESKGISLTNVPFTEYAQYIYQIPVVTSSPLKFTATSNGSIGWSSGTYPNLEFNKNGDGWSAFNSTINVNTGDYVEFRNNGTAWTATNDNSHFTTTGLFDLTGVLMSLVDRTAQATTIGTVINIFAYLFTGCGIVEASAMELPTNTYIGCYYHMFENCTSLVGAPVLPALSCAPQCYSGMFYGCSSLGYLEAMFTTKPIGPTPGEFTYGWLDGVAATGTFVKNTDATWVNTTVTNPNSGFVYEVIPSGWTIQCPLTFTALTAGSTVKIMAHSNAPSINISYAMDDEWKYGGWQQYQVGDTITLTNVGDKVSFGGDGINNSRLASSTSQTNRNYFVMTGSISAGGDVTSLLNGYGGDYQMNEGQGGINDYCLHSLFQDCTALVKAPNLPSTKLANYSYQRMFYGCTNLVTPPAELIAVTCSVGNNSNYEYRDVYSQMFYGCTSLVNTPHMKGIGNSRSTYARTPGYAASQMFYNCTALRNIYASGTWILGVKGYNSSTTTYSCSNWMQNVPQNVGTIHLPNTSGYSGFDTFLNNRGNSGAPVGWSVSYDISI